MTKTVGPKLDLLEINGLDSVDKSSLGTQKTLLDQVAPQLL